MAKVLAGPAGFDMTDLDLSALLDGFVLARTATAYVLGLGDEIVTFVGEGFTYDGFGVPNGGTITAIVDRTPGGQLISEWSGLSVPVDAFVGWVESGDTLAAARAILAGADTLTASANPEGAVLAGLGGDDLLTGGPHGDLLDGGAGDNTIFGGDGDDLIGAPESTGSNYLRGGAGDDIVIGGAGRDDANGNQGHDSIDGGAGGDDWLLGGQGDDLVAAHAGNVVLNGNLGADTVAGGSGNDTVRGGQGDDIVNGGAGDDHLFGDRGSDTMAGGSGADVIHFQAFGGADRVLDFKGAEGDRVQLNPGAAYTLRQAGANAEIVVAGGDTLTLIGVQSSDLAGWILA